MQKVPSTKLSSDGLRYQAKAGGSPFGTSVNTRSCFKCGKHRRPDGLKSVRILGRSELVCKPNCEEA